MFKKNRNFFLGLTAVFLSASAVAESVRPNVVTMFYLPIPKQADVTSFEVAQPYELKAVHASSGAPGGLTQTERDFGIDTPAGLSFAGVGEKASAENLATPSKVLIFPPENRKKRSSTKGTPLVDPSPVQIYKIPDAETLVTEISKKQSEVKTAVSKSKVVQTKKTRLKPSEALKVLKKCDADVDSALTVLAEALSLDTLPVTISSCAVFDVVASYLKTCHPYPVVYYTPTNAAVARRISMQKAVDLLTSHYTRKQCGYLDLAHVNFEKAEFYKSSLENVDFSGSYFNFATFMDGNFSNGIFKNALIDNALIQNADFSGGFFKGARVKDTHILKTDLRMTNFVDASLVNTQLRHVRMSASDLTNADMANTRWEHVDARRVSAENTDFTNSVMTDTVLTNLYGPDANFSSVVCDKCFFDGAKLERAQFYKTALTETSFFGANLERANFENAVFNKTLNVNDANLYLADFKKVDMHLFDGVPVEKLRLLTIDRKTVMPASVPDFDSSKYDTALAEAERARPNFNKWNCSEAVCRDRLQGRATKTNLTVRAMTVLENKKETEDNKAWAICTMSCLAQADKGLDPSQTDLLAAYVRRERPWSAKTALQQSDNKTPWGVLDNPLTPDIQQILYILISLPEKHDLGYDIDLTNTDLRGADLSRGNLRGINFAGANLSMADMSGSTVRRPYAQFDGIVFNDYTLFPDGMTSFSPKRSPYRVFPDNWPPETVTVVRNRLNRKVQNLEQIPYPAGEKTSETKKDDEK